jgi:hypothetical protein
VRRAPACVAAIDTTPESNLKLLRTRTWFAPVHAPTGLLASQILLRRRLRGSVNVSREEKAVVSVARSLRPKYAVYRYLPSNEHAYVAEITSFTVILW